tara:strand:+ start:4580 stop:4714 length:135 start_codon:yes stop_codon:yes gene_type:complete
MAKKGLAYNINKCKKNKTCKSKKKSTVSNKAYAAMKNKWKKSKA